MINHKYMNKKGFSFIELVLVIFIIFIIFILYAMSRPNVRPVTGYRIQKACYSNIRVLMGAAELYNMDVKEEEQMKSLDIKHLIKTKYLKDEPVLPDKEKCVYYSEYIEEDGLYVWCKYHGDLIGHLEGDFWKED